MIRIPCEISTTVRRTSRPRSGKNSGLRTSDFGLVLRVAWILLTAPALATPPGQVANTPVRPDLLDRPACNVWVDGHETDEGSLAPEQVLWMTEGRPKTPYGEHFGPKGPAGPRHQRYAFREPIPVGSVFCISSGRVSVLKESVPYPGDMGDESQWTPAECLVRDGTVTTLPQKSYALWTLPPDTRTRAIRISCEPAPLDDDRRGWINNILVLRERFQSIAPFAHVVTEVNADRAPRLIDQHHDGLWNTWSNVDGRRRADRDALPPVSRDNPGVFSLVWPAPVELDALVCLHTGFRTADVDVYTGPADQDPGMAREEDWTFVKTFGDLDLHFPWTMPNILPFDRTLRTRAIRMRLVETAIEDHDHVRGQGMDGRRVYLDDVMALRRLPDAEPLAAPAFVAALERDLHPPIPVAFTLPEAGRVTLVVEDSTGRRVRNLCADLPCPAGRNTVWWDGSDDLGRDVEAANHGLLRIPAQPVAPGTYTVRGLWHKDIVPVYEFGAYAPGRFSPTPTAAANWLANHTNPQSAAFVPADRSPLGEPLVYLGALVTEGPHGLIWVDAKGEKRGGLRWIGGNWLAAPHLAADHGSSPDARDAVYVAGVFGRDGDDDTSEVRLNAIRRDNPEGVREIGRYEIARGVKASRAEDRAVLLSGIAAHDGRVALALPRRNAVWIVDARTGGIVRKIDGIDDLRGIAYAPDGSLRALSGRRVVAIGEEGAAPVVAEGLEDPVGLAIDADARLYVSDRGASHQVKVFGPDGRLLRIVGHPGAPKSGPYDELHMNNPHGLAVDDRNRLWVAENNGLPKRVSVWGPDGRLLRAWYGPGKYGEGGTLDAHRPDRFYYAEREGTMEFRLDWERGRDKLVSVLFRNGDYGFTPPGGYGDWGGGAEYATYHDGRRYLSNGYNNNPIAGPSTMTVFVDNGDGTIRPCVSIGTASNWKELQRDEFRDRWPDPDHREHGLYLWCDLDGDGRMTPAELAIHPQGANGFLLMPDMCITISQHNGRALRLRPQWVAGSATPRYRLEDAEVLAADVYGSMSDGGDYALADDSDEVVLAKSLKPFAPHSLSGVKAGRPAWSYPSLWPGLHASHTAPVAKEPGELVGTVRVLGPLMRPRGSQVAPLWFMSGNTGSLYLFTRDGLFVSSLFGDARSSRPFGLPEERRGTAMVGMTIGDEDFWPTATCTDDGRVYLVVRSRILRVDGLDTLRPIAPFRIQVTAADLDKACDWRIAREKQRRLREGIGILRAPLRDAGAMAVDGDFADWEGVGRVDIERRGASAWFDSDSRPFELKGAVAVCGDRLHILWETGDRDLLRNTGENPVALFKTGGCLDLMLGTDPRADAKRDRPVPGDLRLLVTRVNGRPRALVYRQKVARPDRSRAVPFSSPTRTILFDQVDDVSAEIQLAGDDQGRFEASIPLRALGLAAESGQRLRADIGVLRGADGQTIARHYWSNKSTAITSDVPSEAELTPGLWGVLEFVR